MIKLIPPFQKYDRKNYFTPVNHYIKHFAYDNLIAYSVKDVFFNRVWHQIFNHDITAPVLDSLITENTTRFLNLGNPRNNS